MQLTPATNEALDKWLGVDTWYKNSDNDMNRFYDFVDQYQKAHGFSINEADLQKLIEQKLEKRVSEQFRLIIRERINLAYSILDFLERTGR